MKLRIKFLDDYYPKVNGISVLPGIMKGTCMEFDPRDPIKPIGFKALTTEGLAELVANGKAEITKQ